jgi:peptidoglycan hydrolase-like amidase
MIFVLLLSFFAGPPRRAGLVWADVDCSALSGDDKKTCEDINQQLSDLKKSLDTNQGESSKLEAKLKSIQSQINVAVNKLKFTEQEIKDRSEKVSTQYIVLSVKIREMYMRLRSQPLWISLLSKSSMGEVRRELVYRQDSNDKDKQIIVNLVQEIGSLEVGKKALEIKKIQLAKLQVEFDKQNIVFQTEIKKLSSKIAQLSAQQQSLLAEKTGTFSTTVGDVPLADDPASRPDYNPGFSPAFAAFSFGAPHFKGMSQYGAYGRAKSGQNAEEILHAYYGGVDIKKDYDAGKQISVEGYGRMDIEAYVKRIYEVPGSWGDSGGMEALKAQAVAARSYALAWTREGTGGAICTTERCQVYKNSDKGGKWEEAVNATRGWVMMKDGKIINAWYASTSGGYQESYNALEYLKNGSSYNTPGFWDTPSGRGGWTSQAYEKTAGSPWFYKAWYKNRSGNNCGRSHPWLTSDEMADILNAVVVYKGGDASHVWPLDYQSCFGGSKDIWSREQMKNEADNKGGSFSSVSGVSVTYGENGVTANVHFDTNRGGFDVSGKDFYTVFNLRVSGRIALLSGLFNIEKK